MGCWLSSMSYDNTFTYYILREVIMRYKIVFSYDGTNFNGYQIQPKLRTVQEALEKAVSYLNKQTPTSVTASGRTDKGVHALGQVASFDLKISNTVDKIKRGLNSNLPDDIHVISVEKVSDDFHARYSAKKKEYVYKINIGEYNPIERNYIFQYNKELNIENMIKAIKYFEGKHDFTSFVPLEDLKDNPIRTVYKTNIKRNKDILEISFIANGFMKYQVRNMVGLLIAVGEGKKDVSDVEKIIRNKNRSQKFKTAASCGLYLKKVWY